MSTKVDCCQEQPGHSMFCPKDKTCPCGKTAVYWIDTCAIEGGTYYEPLAKGYVNIPLGVICQECMEFATRECDLCGESLGHPDHDWYHKERLEVLLKEHLKRGGPLE